MYYAHTSSENKTEVDWQKLESHLRGVAERAGRFASDFDSELPAYAVGLLHDLGKYSREFQEYLKEAQRKGASSGKVDHSSAGAQVLNEQIPLFGHLYAYLISGHHSGLLDHVSNSAGCLTARLAKTLPDWRNPESLRIVEEIRNLNIPMPSVPKDAFHYSLLGRMLYSCLTDADALDTESFMSPENAAKRPVWDADILSRMNEKLDRHLSKFKADNPVRTLRAQILRECQEAAELEPGIFTLTVPTGGGKTYSSLSFALRHALKYGKKRILYIIPFISIIEQNAAEFRNVFRGLFPDPVLEVHSNLSCNDREKENEEGENHRKIQRRLASENFDAPLVVTTAVQFYESLMGNRSSQCRKLHNLANSVIILDEVQKIPVKYLEVVLKLFQELVSTFRCSLVLCTATQPAVTKSRYLPIGLEIPSGREIIHDPRQLYLAMKRVNIINLGLQTDVQLLERFEQETSFLCVVNTKAHASKLFHGLKHREGDYHLSTSMVPVHRLKILEEIRKRLASKLPCRVISTQLVEAGVDLDFPVVYRSMAGADSIAQAAGRCNREGLSESGSVYVFLSEHQGKERFQKAESYHGKETLECYPEDPLGLEAIENYFQRYYKACKDWDEKGLMSRFHFGRKDTPFLFEYESAANDFQLIDQDTVAVIVPYENGAALCEELRKESAPSFELLRRLQPYTVPLRRSDLLKHAGREIELLFDEYPVLISMETNYHKDTGLFFEEDYNESAYFI